MITPSTLCPCGSKKSYSLCCGIYISGAKSAPTAEALMRSRYTAYSQANICYIQATMCDRAAEGYDPIEAARWAKSLVWKGLQVLEVFPHLKDRNRAYVSFVVRYTFQDIWQEMAEVSEFKQYEGKWYYVGMKEG